MLDGVGEIKLASELFTLTVDEFPSLGQSIFVILKLISWIKLQSTFSKSASSIHSNHLEIGVEHSKIRDYEGTML